MKRITLLLLITFNIISYCIAQQKVMLKGKVVTSNGDAVEGATVSLHGTSIQTSTNTDGFFSIEYSNPSTVVVTAIGYNTYQTTLNGQTTISFQLDASSESIEQVVVVGYGTQKKGEVTSSIASVRAEDFTKGAIKDAGQLIQGKVAGLRVTTPNGDPNGITQINLRGLNSINGSQNPLVIIDGIPGNINTVAPEDIESVDVLKDGSAAAIYGTRATSGVILITTRRNTSKESKSTVEYNNYVNWQTLFRKPEMLTADDYRRLIGEGKTYEDLESNTNWVDEVTQSPVSH